MRKFTFLSTLSSVMLGTIYSIATLLLIEERYGFLDIRGIIFMGIPLTVLFASSPLLFTYDIRKILRLTDNLNMAYEQMRSRVGCNVPFVGTAILSCTKRPVLIYALFFLPIVYLAVSITIAFCILVSVIGLFISEFFSRIFFLSRKGC